MSVDLHCHTNISDNSKTIEEVITLAKANGVTHLAITDHDTTDGVKEAQSIGKQIGVNIIPGIEISAYDYRANTRAHILGFHVQPNHFALEDLCNPIVEQRHEACKLMVTKVIKAGYEITWEQVEEYAEGGTGVYKQHIMHALIDAGYTDKITGDLYRQLFNRGENNHPKGTAYVPVKYVDVIDAIAAIRQAGGVPVIAHPVQFNNFDSIPEWVDCGLQGIEKFHNDHNESIQERCQQIADQHHLVITGGSDYHGFYGKPDNTIGINSPGVQSVLELERLAKLNVKLNVS